MNKRLILLLILVTSFYGCSTTEKATESRTNKSNKEKNIDFSTLREPPKDWYQLDEKQTQFRGISSEKAYQKLLKNKKPKKQVVVAVIDGGVDINHEDLKNEIWTNKDEIPDNNKDDDHNGYVDDVHGWNFIGGPDGKNVHYDTFELTRIYRELNKQFSTVDTTQLNPQQEENFERYKKIKSSYEQKVHKLLTQYKNIESLDQSMTQAKAILKQHFGDSTYTYEDVEDLQPTDQQLNFAKNVMSYVMKNEIDSAMIADQKKQVYDQAKYNYNPDFHTRQIVGDDYSDKTQRIYGNNDVAGPGPFHGTHVSGIIAADRTNNIGIKGIATNTLIMPVRAIPDGDERDKDVANAIRYAVDNGADIINMSFGKAYSPDKEVVDAAVKYADEHGVLMVHAAGNDGKNTDLDTDYPTDQYGKNLDGGTANLWISVGASTWKPGDHFIASFSNYGDKTVDLFAPGYDIYSSVPNNKYKREDGTSMASPVVAGTAALIMAYYPKLTAQQVKNIILQSAKKYPDLQVIVPNENSSDKNKKEPFSDLSVSHGEVNVYNALKMAARISKQ